MFTGALVPLDYILLVAAALTAYAIRFAPLSTNLKPVQFNLPLGDFLPIVLGLALVYVAVFALAGLYAVRPPRIATELSRVFLANSAALACVLAIAFFSRELFDSRFIVLAVWGLSITYIALGRLSIRYCQRLLKTFGLNINNVVIIGKTNIGNDLSTWFSRNPSLGYRVLLQTAHFTEETAEKLQQLKKNRSLDGIFLANTDADKYEIAKMKMFADTEHVAFYYAPDLFPGSTLKPIVHNFGGRPIIEVPKTPLDGWGAIYKRGFDIVVALFLIIITLPIQIITAIALFIEQPGSILFRTLPNGELVTRVGQGGAPFSYFKFRSMVKNAHQKRFDPKFIKEHGNDRSGTPLFKLKDDPRVTRIGKFIRKYSIDELPEFYLVLAGSMSLVGPRPHLPEEVAKYRPNERRVLTIKPGITGLAQISGRANLAFEDEVKLDMHYIENWSPWLDLIILIKTPIAVLLRKGAY